MNVKPEKPKKPGTSTSVSDEDAIFKQFLKEHDSVLNYLEALLSDIHKQLDHYRLADYSRDVATLRRRYASEGLSFATKTLPSLFSAFLQHLETGKPSYPGFKLDRDGKRPVFLRQLFAMASGSDDEDRVTACRGIYQLCHAFKKLKGPYRKRTLQKQLWSFVDTDIDLKYLDLLSGDCLPVIKLASKYVQRIVGDLSPEFDALEFVPRPGPGATNTPRQKNVRYRPHVLYEQLDEVFPYEEWFFSHPWDLVTDPKRLTSLERVCAPASRFKFVDKTYAKPRGICIEEQETQYLQQGIKRALYRRISKHPHTKGRVNFTDQSVNGKLALKSSGDQMYATIDMSEASDRISRRLVRYLFRGAPDLLDALMATSTRTITLPDGLDFITDFPCEKFAPMGSAVCFPVMSLSHFVLIRAILTKCGYPRSLAHDVYVYGDDIIVRSECVDDVYKWLPKFGMKLNTDKSYHLSHFRESCGVHAFHGVEITPVYFKYTPKSHSPLGVCLSLRATERDLFKRGFYETATLLRSEIQKVRALRGYPIPYVTPKSKVFGWIREDIDAPLCRYSGLKRRWNKDTQNYLYRALVVVPLSDDLRIEQASECYLRWLIEHPQHDRKPSRPTSYMETSVPTPQMYVCNELYKRTMRRKLAVDYARVTQSTEQDTQVVKESQDDHKIIWAGCPDSAF